MPMKRNVLSVSIAGGEVVSVGSEFPAGSGRIVESITPKTLSVYYGNGTKKITDRYIVKLTGDIIVSVNAKMTLYSVLSAPVPEEAPTAEEIAMNVDMA